MNEKFTLTLKAELNELDKLLSFSETHMALRECPMKIIMQMSICIEEIFVNIAHYAYGGKAGGAVFALSFFDEPRRMVISFQDSGVQYDPLSKADPDITLSAEDRKIGGLGIFMTKKSVDKISYEYEDGKNILTFEKRF